MLSLDSLYFFGAFGSVVLAPFFVGLARASLGDTFDQTLERVGAASGSIPDALGYADFANSSDRFTVPLDSLGGVFVVTALLLAVGFVLAPWLSEPPVRRATTPNTPTTPNISDPSAIAERGGALQPQPRLPTDSGADDASGTVPPPGNPQPPAT